MSEDSYKLKSYSIKSLLKKPDWFEGTEEEFVELLRYDARKDWEHFLKLYREELFKRMSEEKEKIRIYNEGLKEDENRIKKRLAELIFKDL